MYRSTSYLNFLRPDITTFNRIKSATYLGLRAMSLCGWNDCEHGLHVFINFGLRV
jgi:hypothetical protein